MQIILPCSASPASSSLLLMRAPPCVLRQQEKLWSPRAATADAAAALPRIQAFRCLLNERGVAAAPVTNDEARAAPSGPGSCLAQRRRRQK